MIVCAAKSMPIGVPITRFYEGPQTNGQLTQTRIMALRVATREEYLEHGRMLFPDTFDENEDLRRGWTNYYEVSID